MTAFPHLRLDTLKSIRLFDQLPVLFELIIVLNKQQTKQPLEINEQRLLLQFLFENLLQNHPVSKELESIVQLQGAKFVDRALTVVSAKLNEVQFTKFFELACQKAAYYLPGLLGELVSFGLRALEQARELTEAQQQTLISHRSTLRPIAVRVGNQQFEQNAARFKEDWSSAQSPEHKRGVLQWMLAKQNVLIEVYGTALFDPNRVVDLQYLDFTNVDFAQLDLQFANINHSIFNHADLGHARCTVGQFLQVGSSQDARFETATERAIVESKQRFLREKLPNLITEVRQTSDFISTIADLSYLVCDGTVPDLIELTDERLKFMLDAALKNFFLNTLPPEDEYSQVRYCESGMTLNDLSGFQLQQLLSQMLQCRNFQLSKDVIAYAQNQSMSIIYEQVSNHWNTLLEIERIFMSLPALQQDEFQQTITGLKQSVQAIKHNKAVLKREYVQRLIDAFIECLFDDPDPVLGCSAMERLESALSAARFEDHLVVDLRNTDLSKFQFNKHTDFSNVYVQLTPEQERALPRLMLQQRYSRLIRAIEEENIDEIQICMKQKLNPNYADERGRTVFMSACFNNKPSAVRCLLQYDVNLDLKTQDDVTPSGEIIRGKTIIEGVARIQLHTIVDILIKHGAILDFVSGVFIGDISRCQYQEADFVRIDDSGDLPLHIAAKYHFNALVNNLLDLKVDINQLNRGKRTPLSIAIEKGYFDTVELLLRRGANVQPADVRRACESNNRKIAELLRNSVAQIDLYTAMYLGEIETMKQIIGENYDDEFDGYTPLAIACRVGNVDLIKWLLNENASPYILAKDKLPMSHAIECLHVEAVVLLLQHGVSATAKINNPKPALFYAISENYANFEKKTEILKAMLALCDQTGKALIQVDDKYIGRPALFWAVANGLVEVVDSLLRAGANPWATDSGGNTALHCAAQGGHAAMLLPLAKAMLSDKCELFLMSKIEAVCDNNLYLYLIQEESKTSLFYATKKLDGIIIREELTRRDMNVNSLTRIIKAIEDKNLQSISKEDKNEIFKITSNRGHTRKSVFDLLAQRQKSHPSEAYMQAFVDFFEHGPRVAIQTAAPSIDKPETVPVAENPVAANELPKPPKKAFQYIRHIVDPNGDCGYTAFGITRHDAYQRLLQHIESIRELLTPVLQEALITEQFIDYLHRTGELTEEISLFDVQDKLAYYANDFTIIRAYLTYDVIEKHIDSGWAHPTVLQALASIQGILLYLWQLDPEGKLVPHADPRFASFTPEHAEEEPTHLLFVNQNHFDRIELEYFHQQQPAPIPANKNISRLIAKYGAMPAPNSPVILTIHAEKPDEEEMLSLKK